MFFAAYSVRQEKIIIKGREQSSICLNYLDYQRDVKKIISKTVRKLIVNDNADILLDDDTRKYISLDEKNQYLIIGRNPRNLFATKEKLFELVSEKIGEQTKFMLKEYL